MNTATLIALDAAAGFVALAALHRVWTAPTWMWPHRTWSKLAWTAIVVWLNVTTGHVIWPVGAVLALRRAAKLTRQPLHGPPPLPYATGEDSSTWWNVDPDSGIRWTGEKDGVHMGTCSTCGHFDEHWDEFVTYADEEEDVDVLNGSPLEGAARTEAPTGTTPQLRLIAGPEPTEDEK